MWRQNQPRGQPSWSQNKPLWNSQPSR
jgi:hypothetical protein